MREMRNDRGRVFLMCLLSKTDPRFPKYPRLPVQICARYTRRAEKLTPPLPNN
jgi:hypothetical protein